jgi:hypothetical protein
MALGDNVDGDAFETVAITWSQPEAAVMLSMFEFYGIPAFALGQRQAAVNPTYIVAIQGIHVRVHHTALDEALDLLGEVAARPAAMRPYLWGSPWSYPIVLALSFVAAVIGYANWASPLAVIAIFPLSVLMIAIPPTRTPSTFLLSKRSRAP